MTNKVNFFSEHCMNFSLFLTLNYIFYAIFLVLLYNFLSVLVVATTSAGNCSKLALTARRCRAHVGMTGEVRKTPPGPECRAVCGERGIVPTLHFSDEL